MRGSRARSCSAWRPARCPETLRIARPGTTVAFAKRDAVAEGYEEAVRAARSHGFDATLRLAGGRAAVFHDGTMEIGHARA